MSESVYLRGTEGIERAGTSISFSADTIQNAVHRFEITWSLIEPAMKELTDALNRHSEVLDKVAFLETQSRVISLDGFANTTPRAMSPAEIYADINRVMAEAFNIKKELLRK